MKRRHLQHFSRVNKIFPGQQWTFAGMTNVGQKMFHANQRDAKTRLQERCSSFTFTGLLIR